MKKVGFIALLSALIILESYYLIMESENKDRIATFGSGCFWCTEAVFEQLEGVEKVISGYSGGDIKNPSYKEVTSGRTGHAEVCQIHYDPDIISYEELLDVFWHTHDPTTLNRQGNDTGTQYRSAVFYHSDKQKQLAEESRSAMVVSGIFSDPIVTEITEFKNFYEAENYHQDYFKSNPSQPYCTFIVKPKVDKFKAKYQDKLK
ncbi:peptide-methionine (S)-S-oxide reductase MsrA [Bacteroidota bacterium]